MQQFSAESVASEVGGNGLSRLLRWRAGVEEDYDRRPRSTEGCAEDAWFPHQLLQTREQGTEWSAVWLVDAVSECNREQVVTAQREGGEQEHGILDVRNSVGARVLRWKHTAGFFRGKSLFRNGEKQGPLPFWKDRSHLNFVLSGHARNGQTAHPTGGGVIGVVFAAGGFADDPGVSPAQTAELIGQGDTSQPGRSGGSTALADRNLVLDAKRQRNHCRAMRLKDLAIGGENQVILDTAADFLVSSGGYDGKARGAAGIDVDVDVHCQSSGIEGRS